MDPEKRALLGFLGAQRRRAFVIIDGLSEPVLRRAVLPSGWTCLELIHHLALEERLWFRGIVGGEAVRLPESVEDDTAEWRVGADVCVDAVLGMYRDEIMRGRRHPGDRAAGRRAATRLRAVAGLAHPQRALGGAAHDRG